MKIPKIKMTVPVFTEREYAPTSVSVNPEQEIDVTMEPIEVSIEYAAFLANLGVYPLNDFRCYTFLRDEYIEEIRQHPDTPAEVEKLMLRDYGVTTQFYTFLYRVKEIEYLRNVERMLDNAIEKDNTTVRDWI